MSVNSIGFFGGVVAGEYSIDILCSLQQKAQKAFISGETWAYE